jgi:hypothetical protein
MKRVDVSAVCIIPEMIFYQYLHSDLSFWHAGIIEQPPPAFVVRPGRTFLVSGFLSGSLASVHSTKTTNQKLETRNFRLKAFLRIPFKLASIVSALLFFVGKWFASSKHSFWEDVIR